MVRTDARVAKILTEGDRVVGAVLDSGEEFRAPVIVSAVHPKVAFLQLLERDALPGEFVRDIERYKTRSGTVKINVALSELPDLRYAPRNAAAATPYGFAQSMLLATLHRARLPGCPHGRVRLDGTGGGGNDPEHA